MIGTPEGEIKSVWDCIAEAIREAGADLNCKSIFLHVISEALYHLMFFSGREELGIKACSVHPMYPLDSKSTAYEKFNKAVYGRGRFFGP